MEIISIDKIPLMVELSNGIKVNLQERFLTWMNGKGHPISGYFKNDILKWIEWEGIVNLRDYCQF